VELQLHWHVTVGGTYFNLSLICLLL